MPWNVEFFSDDGGRRPVREWLASLEPAKRNAAIAAIEIQLAELGLDVCATEHGKQLGEGLFEFRIRHDEGVIRRKAGGKGGSSGEKVLLRIFCHAYGEKIILLLGAYDKGADPTPRRQQREIDTARRRLRSFKLARRREAAGKRRRN
jgi:phage-related protein